MILCNPLGASQLTKLCGPAPLPLDALEEHEAPPLPGPLPPGFPELRRLTLALGAGDFFRFTLQTYLAVTSNSFQSCLRVFAKFVTSLVRCSP